jgi:hypothetical protein
MKKNKVEYVKDTFDEYLSKSDYVSASDLKTFLKSPRKYFYEKNRTESRVEKRHFAIGSAVHEYIMEKEQFDKNFIVSPKFDKRTKVGKEQYADFQLKADGKTIIDVTEMEMIEQMAVNIKMNRTFNELLEGSNYEISCYTVDEPTGLKVRLRPDILPPNKSTIVDIKSCIDSSPKKFKNDVYSYGYSLSAAYYLDFLKRENYVFAAIEKTAPFQASMYCLNDEMVDFGRFQYRMGLDLLKWSKENNYWCDYVEFEILKESYLLGDLTNVIDTIEKSELINILQ